MKRLFVDPGSKSAGWAYFEGKKCIAVGTWRMTEKNAFSRLAKLFTLAMFTVLQYSPAEVHFEIMNHRVHHIVIQSVGVIGAAAASKARVSESVPIKSWQKHCNWEEIQHKWETVDSPVLFDSEDAWAAYWQGVWWLAEQERYV